jgi:hypothetical protein
MTDNPFDQFDDHDTAATPLSGKNPFDQFDPNAITEPKSTLATIAEAPAVGFNKGIAQTLGAPVDLINWGMKKVGLPVSDTPFGGSESIKKSMGIIGANPNEYMPNSPLETGLQSFGSGIAGAIAPEFAIQGALYKMGTRAPEIINTLIGTGVSPAATTVNALAGGVGGVTGNISEAMVPDKYKPIAQTVGNLIGGVGTGAAAVGARAAKDIVAPKISSFVEPITAGGTERLAARNFKSAFTDPNAAYDILQNAANVRQTGEALGEIVPGSRPTTGQLTGDKGALSTERAIVTQNPELFKTNEFGTGAEQQNAARTAAVQGIQPTGAPEDVSTVLRNRLQDIQTEHDQAVAAATQRAQEKAATIGFGSTPEDIGESLRQPLADARAAAKNSERSLWNAVDPDGTLSLPSKPVTTAANNIASQLAPTAKPMAGEEAAIFDTAANLPPVTPFNDLTALRSRVSAEMRKELVSNGSSPTYARLTQLRGSIEDAIQNAVEHRAAYEQNEVAQGLRPIENTMEARLAAERNQFLSQRTAAENSGAGNVPSASGRPVGAPSDNGTIGSEGGGLGANEGAQGIQNEIPYPNVDAAAAQRLAAASQATRERAQTFDTGVIGNVLRQGQAAQTFKMPVSSVPAKVFPRGPSGAETVNAYLKAAGPDRGIPAISDAASESLRREAMTPEGVIDPDKFARWQAAHQDSLRALPASLSDRFSNAASATQAIAEAAARRKQAISDYQAGAVGRVLGVSSPSDVTARIGNIIGASDAVKQMTAIASRIAGDENGIAGLRKAVADSIIAKSVGTVESGTSGIANLNASTFQKTISNNIPVLKAAGFTDQEINRMSAIAKDLQRSQRTLQATRLPGGSNTTQDILSHLAKGPPSQQTLMSKILSSAGAGWAGSKAAGIPGAIAGFAGGVGMGVANSFRDAGIHSAAEMVRDAMLNPELAMALLQKAPIKINQGSEITLRNVLGRQSMLATQEADDQSLGEPPPQQSAGGRVPRKSGGKVQSGHQHLVDRLFRLGEQAKKTEKAHTEPLLDLPDETVAKALDVAQRAI